MRWQKASKLWGRDQGQHESVDAYVAALQKIAKSAGVHDDMLRYATLRELRKELGAHVIQSNATTLSGLVEAAQIAEIAAGDGSASTSDAPYLGPFAAVANLPGRRTLRSGGTSRLIVPSVRRSTVGDRAFSVAGPQPTTG